MKIIIPNNLFSVLFTMSLPQNFKENMEVKPSSMIAKDINDGGADIGLIPSFELITRRDLFISKKYAISLDGELSSSYIYFNNKGKDFTEFLFRGDVTSNEILLSKIIFSEKYNSEISTNLDTQQLEYGEKDYIVCGNENYLPELLGKGLSLAEEVADIIDFPYTNYVFASKSEEKIAEFNDAVEKPEKIIQEGLGDLLDKINPDENVKDFIIKNIDTLYFDMTENEAEGLKELLYLPFVHGMMDDMVDLKFAE